MFIVQGSDWRKYRGKGTTFHDRNYGATASKEHRRDPSTVYRSIWPSCHWSQILGGSIWHGLFHKGFGIIWDLQTNLDVLDDLVWCEVGRRKLFDQYDYNFIVGIRKLQDLVATKSFQSVQAKIVQIKHEDCQSVDQNSDAHWECLVRHYALTNYHPTSTCKMGAPNDKTAVVDPDLKWVDRYWYSWKKKPVDFERPHLPLIKKNHKFIVAPF